MKWIDMHCDTLSEIVKIKETDRNTAESLYRNHLCVDAERLRQTDSAAQFFACYVNAAEYGDKDMKMTCERKLPVRRDDSGRWDTAYEAVLKMIGEAYCGRVRRSSLRRQEKSSALRDFALRRKSRVHQQRKRKQRRQKEQPASLK